ncbi:hypothetical protein Tco_1272333 [Tanacetum coccineum]
MDDEPMWAADYVVAPTPGFGITIPETANEFAIKDSKVSLIWDEPFSSQLLNAVIELNRNNSTLELELNRMDFQYRLCNEHSIQMMIPVSVSINPSRRKEIFAEFDEFMAMTTDENSNSESDTEDPPFEKITINTDYKIKTSLEEPPTDLELKPLPIIDNIVLIPWE